MKFTLKDYQADAVEDILANFKRARENFKNPDKKETSSFSLTATTGAGKTVMAAAAIEALFWGSDSFSFEPDPGAVVLWFSDDPNLNIQTLNRLRQASEKFNTANLVQINPPFDKPRLEPGKVYFLNTQKLTKSSLLTRGHKEAETVEGGMFSDLPVATPDRQGWTIWQTIANTIEADDLTLYFVLDEAHRGFNGNPSSDKQTIVRKLVNGTKERPPIPIVWGISATIDHFQNAMRQAEVTSNRRALPDVRVDPVRVQESGLVKDTLVLDIPNEGGQFESVLLRRGARKLKETTLRWMAYARTQGLTEAVSPLLVLQLPNRPNSDEVGRALDTIFEQYPELGNGVVRHVLGEHSTLQFGAWAIDWIEPQRVQDESHIRILIAKDAISTGWDCPRAEVLVSFRPAKDHTHITQLLGRMVRNPLARRIPGDERLNSVHCILPFFDRATALGVVRFLTGDATSIPGGEKKVVVDSKELARNPDVPKDVWEALEKLPTEVVPRRGGGPVKRLVALAHALSSDAVFPGAITKVEKELHCILDAYAKPFPKKLEEAIREVWDVRIKQIEGQFGDKEVSFSEIIERADDRSIRAEFEAAKKAFGADIAQSYVNHLADLDLDADDDSLRDAYVRTAALATIKDVREKIDRDVIELTDKLFETHRVAIKQLPDIRRSEYDEIKALAVDPQEFSLTAPRTRVEGFSVEKKGELVKEPLVPLHLMSDENGQFPLMSLNDWEQRVVLTELSRPSVRGWYRNPSRAAADSLGIAYRDEDTANWRSMHPDFIFFNEVEGKIVASILDPHGHHLDDALMKLKALAEFAGKYGERFHRIESLAEIDGKMKVIDVKNSEAREIISRHSGAARELYIDGISVDYDFPER